MQWHFQMYKANIPFLHSRIRHASLFHKSRTKVGAKLPISIPECHSLLFWKLISPRNEKSFCSHENFRSTWKLRPTWETETKLRSTWVSFRLLHVSTPRAQTADRNEFQTDLKLRPVWVCSCEGGLSSFLTVGSQSDVDKFSITQQRVTNRW